MFFSLYYIKGKLGFVSLNETRGSLIILINKRESTKELCVFSGEILYVFIGFLGPMSFVVKIDNIKRISNNVNKYNNLSFIC